MRAAAASAALLVATAAGAQEPGLPGEAPPFPIERRFSSLAILVEQDLFHRPTNDDRNYTMGVGVLVSGGFLTRPLVRSVDWLYAAKPLELLDRLVAVSRLHQDALSTGEGGSRSHALVFGVTAFTPDAIASPDPQPDDRPYASLAFLSVARSSVHPVARRVIKSELTLGALGWDIARRVQTWIHEQGTSPIPRGWSHQISDGGEPTAKYRLAITQLLSETRGHDLALSTEGNVGYYTNAAVGLALRVGLLRTDFALFDPAPLQSYNEAEGSRAGRGSPRALELYGWAAARARLVIYNALLQGQVRESDVTFRSTDVEHVVQEFETGLTLGFRRFQATWVILAGRSPELRVSAPRSHYWGSFHVTYRAR